LPENERHDRALVLQVFRDREHSFPLACEEVSLLLLGAEMLLLPMRIEREDRHCRGGFTRKLRLECLHREIMRKTR
jgi:hypothetical protein